MSEENHDTHSTLESLVIQTVEHYEEITSLLASMDKIVGDGSSTPLAATYYSLLDTHINFIEEVFGIGGLLNWFIWDNGCGTHGLKYHAEYIVDDELVKEDIVVNNIQDFIEMI